MSWDFKRDEEYIKTVEEIKKLLLKIDEPVKDALLAELLVMHHKHHCKFILSELKEAVKNG